MRNVFYVLLSVGLLVAALPPTALAQSLGPVTGNIGETDPTDATFRIGPLLMFSGLTVKSIGIDNNVFDEPTNPKRDFHAIINPDMTLALRTGRLKFTLSSAADFVYYKQYTSERTMNKTMRARAELLLSRFRPFITYGSVVTRERPNLEISLRANQRNQEYVGGVNVEISPQTFAFAGVTRTDYRYREGEIMTALIDGELQEFDLSETLNRRSESAAVGLKRELTPLTSVQLVVRASRDRFLKEVRRDSKGYSADMTLNFAPDALFRGLFTIGYRTFEPENPTVRPYRGLALSGGIFWPIFTSVRLDIEANRNLQYSFEAQEPYYIDTGGSLTVTNRIFGRFDLQGKASYRWLAYGNNTVLQTGEVPQDRVRAFLGGVGYNLQDRSRLSVNYEYTKRDSERRADRVFDRGRVYGAWQYQF